MQIDDIYCVIKYTPTNKMFLCLFQKHYPICLIVHSARIMYVLIDIHDAFDKLSTSHLLYLGQEIYKAELSLALGQQYIQD